MPIEMRLYINITNSCNISCPFCCQSSGPDRRSFMTLDKFKDILNSHTNFELQLEGGEPTVHPDFFAFIEYAYSFDECKKIIIQSNGLLTDRINSMLFRNNGKETVFKVSYNSFIHKITNYKEYNRHLFFLTLFRQNIRFVSNVKLIINARTSVDDEKYGIDIERNLKEHELIENAVIFPIQAYGRSQEGVKPFIKHNIADWKMYASDGTCFGQDLIGRAEYEGGEK